MSGFPSCRTLGLLLVFVVMLAGCGKNEDESSGARSGGQRTPDLMKPPEGAGLTDGDGSQGLDLEWWRRKVPISLFLTGGQRGKLKPCGCSQPQLGGLERAAVVLGKLRQRARRAGGELAGLSVGWSMRGNFEAQEDTKADFLRAVNEEVFALGGVLLGATDLLVPAMCQPRGSSGAVVPHPPINVRLAETNPAADATPFVELRTGDLLVRAVSLLDPDKAEELQAGGFVQAVMTVSRAFEGLTPRPDVVWVVCLSLRNEDIAETLRAGLKRLGPGIVVNVSDLAIGSETLDRAPLKVGSDPLFVDVGQWGKGVGVLDFEPAPVGGGWLVSYRRVELVPQWEKKAGALSREVKELDLLYRTLVRERDHLRTFQRHDDEGARYLGSSACAQCHAAIYNDWKKTHHALALETLQEIDYQWDPECIRCHVVGWERIGEAQWDVTNSAFRTPDKTAYLGGVGCENCHGPGSAHVADPWSQEPFREARAGSVDGAGSQTAGSQIGGQQEAGPNRARPTKATCVKCHDIENSHGFLEGYEDNFLPFVDHRTVPDDRRTVVPERLKKKYGR